jgi:hypothetical protein
MRLISYILIILVPVSLSGCAFIQGQKYQRILNQSAQTAKPPHPQAKAMTTEEMTKTPAPPAPPNPATTGATMIAPITH